MVQNSHGNYSMRTWPLKEEICGNLKPLAQLANVRLAELPIPAQDGRAELAVAEQPAEVAGGHVVLFQQELEHVQAGEVREVDALVLVFVVADEIAKHV